VEARVLKTILGKSINGGSSDRGAIASKIRKPHIVEKNNQDVRASRRWCCLDRPAWSNFFSGIHTIDPTNN
jgi:hypothetical protein